MLDGSDDSELSSKEDETAIRTHRYTEEAVTQQYIIRYTPTYGQVYTYTHIVHIHTHAQMHACM